MINTVIPDYEPSRHLALPELLDALEHETASVPATWEPIWAEMTRRLRVVFVPSRAQVVVFLPLDLTDTTPHVTTDDPVIRGILRKYRARLARTCEVCGSVGKQRRIGLRLRSLCAECAAPAQLQHDARQLLRHIDARESDAPLFWDNVPNLLRVVLQPITLSEQVLAGGLCVRYVPCVAKSEVAMLLRHTITAIDRHLNGQ